MKDFSAEIDKPRKKCSQAKSRIFDAEGEVLCLIKLFYYQII